MGKINNRVMIILCESCVNNYLKQDNKLPNLLLRNITINNLAQYLGYLA